MQAIPQLLLVSLRAVVILKNFAVLVTSPVKFVWSVLGAESFNKAGKCQSLGRFGIFYFGFMFAPF